MPDCGDCKVFKAELFLCLRKMALVTAESDASMCKVGVSKCGDCSIFIPELFNCTDARATHGPVGMQVRADTRACDAFVSR